MKTIREYIDLVQNPIINESEPARLGFTRISDLFKRFEQQKENIQEMGMDKEGFLSVTFSDGTVYRFAYHDSYKLESPDEKAP